jgi:integrase
LTPATDGRRVCKFKEKTLGPALMPKHEAQKKLADYIEQYTGLLTKAPSLSAIATFGDLWTAFCTVKSGFWSQKTKEDLNYLFGKHVLPVLGHQPLGKVTYTSLQLLVNKLAAEGYGETTVTRARTYIKACFEYALDEDLVIKNPARKLEIPTIQKDVCERFLSLEEIGALLSEAEPREHLVLHILAACGLRPAEVLVLRIEDFDGTKLRIDEALKDREKNEARIGRTKTKASNSSVPTPPDLSREITGWIARRNYRAPSPAVCQVPEAAAKSSHTIRTRISSACATRRLTQYATRHALNLFSALCCRPIHPGRDPSTCVAWTRSPRWRSSGPKPQRQCNGVAQALGDHFRIIFQRSLGVRVAEVAL